MKRATRMATATVASGIMVAALAAGTSTASAGTTPTTFQQTNLVSNISTEGAQLLDVNLQNPWGLAFTPTSPLWVSDNNSGVATLYSINVGGTTVSKVGLTVTVPGGRKSTHDGSSPTGQVYNPTSGFVVTTSAGSGPAPFIFDSESGQITAWSPAADPVAAGLSTGTVERSSPTAVYKGLALAKGDRGTFLYAANFHDGTIDVFNNHFHPVTMPGGFTDPSLPPGYAPFGIQDIHNLIYVTYAEQDAQKHDDVAGPGKGFIDIYTPDGFLVERLASQGTLNAPWGLAIAPSTFGSFAGMLLVGNFGDGRINVFDPFQANHFLGQLTNAHNRPITIHDLWGLKVGTASTGGPGTVLFSAGIDNQHDGLLGSLNPSS
jgi:uncharacterized protein (TIGR03118 family)